MKTLPEIPRGPTGKKRELYKTFLLQQPVFAAFKPLAIGVLEQFVALGFDREETSAVLASHVKTWRYIRAVSNGGKRYNLDGTEADDLSDTAQEAAKKTLAFMNDKRRESQRIKREKALKHQELQGKKETAPVAVKPAPIKEIKPIKVAAPAVKSGPAVIVKKKRTVVIPQ